VDATQIVRTVDARVFGVNTAVWDSYLNFPPNTGLVVLSGPGSPMPVTTLSLIEGMGIRAVRFPGGSTADSYAWTQSDTDNFVSAIPDSGVAFVTVNYGSGTPAEAAAWVNYANFTMGYGIQYWEVGNQVYAATETDDNAPAHDPVEYALRFVQYYQAMKAVDPTIKIGAVVPGATEGSFTYPGEAVTNPATGQTESTWIAVVLSTLKSAGIAPDFLACQHFEQQPGQEDDARLLQAAESPQTGWQTEAAGLRKPLNDYLGVAAAGVELCVTGCNSVQDAAGKQTTSLVNGLYLADSFGSLLQSEFNALIWWDLRNGFVQSGNNSSSLYGWRSYGDYGLLNTSSSAANPDPYYTFNVFYPTYYVQGLLTQFVSPGDSVIKASSDQSLLSVYAAKRADGSLTLLVINKDPANAWTGNINLTGYKPISAEATVYSYGIPQDNASNPDAPTYGIGGTGVAQTTIVDASASFLATFAPYSVSVIDMPTVLAFTTEPASCAVDAGSTAVFAASATGASSYLWEFSADGGSSWSVLNDGNGITSSDGPQLMIANVSPANAGEYRAVAVGANGASSNASVAANLTVSSVSNPGSLVTLSGRGFVGTGDHVLIGGFYIAGAASRTVLIQALGPALTTEGVSSAGVLQKPALVLKDSSGNTLYSNAGWSSGGQTQAQVLLGAAAAAYAQPTLQPGSADSEILVTLPPGGYTAQISGADGGTGVAICAVYQLP
jgi:hypothetical protein